MCDKVRLEAGQSVRRCKCGAAWVDATLVFPWLRHPDPILEMYEAAAEELVGLSDDRGLPDVPDGLHVAPAKPVR